jgi:hypothetical protein
MTLGTITFNGITLQGQLKKRKVQGMLHQSRNGVVESVVVPGKPKIWEMQFDGWVTNDTDYNNLVASFDGAKYAYTDGELTIDAIIPKDGLRINRQVVDKRNITLRLLQYDQA